MQKKKRKQYSVLVFGWEQEGELRTSVKAVLEQRFGLLEEEQE
jgi:hypothetical protein